MRKRPIKLAASMLCANPGSLLQQIQELNASNIALAHIDVMDGHFVPNMTGGADVVACIRSHSKALCDVHLMVMNPSATIEAINPLPGERVCIHIEGGEPLAALTYLRQRGVQVGLAINPGTPLTALQPYLRKLDYVLLLVVNPGFKGQALIPSMLDKLYRLRQLLEDCNPACEILVDGAVAPDNLLQIVEAGANSLVCGPFSCFNNELGGIQPTLKLVRETLQQNGYQVIGRTEASTT